MTDDLTFEQGRDLVEDIVGMATTVLDGGPAVAGDAVRAFLAKAPAPVDTVFRLHTVVGVCAVLAAVYVRRLTGVRTAAGHVWALDPAVLDQPDPHAVAFSRALVCQLNDDTEAAADVVEAHLRAHGARGLAELAGEALVRLARLLGEHRRRAAAGREPR